MKKSDFSYTLPEELIAQHPLEERTMSRLMCLDRRTGGISHRHFYEIGELLRPNDLLVFNNSKVLPARLLGHKEGSGGGMEFVLLERKATDLWEILVKPGRKAKVGSCFVFGDGTAENTLSAKIMDELPGGNRLAKFSYTGEFYSILDRIGHMPLPHYITEELADKDRYQTVYADKLGSAAAPTAGLHFTKELIKVLETEKNVLTSYITLHVGLGTFRPVKENDITKHFMHSEHYFLSQAVADRIREAKRAGGRIIAVGTTSCRTLETIGQRISSLEDIHETEGNTDIFIYPGYEFKLVDGLITNFHLPESTLIMLVSAFAGYENTMKAYETAVKEYYRFYSFGDAMFIADHMGVEI